MDIFLFIAAALCAYFICGINPAIVISKLVYKKDIRTCGSGNAGFTNFKRNFGHKWAWWVLLFDLLKAAVVIATFAVLFKYFSTLTDRKEDLFTFGAVYTGLFCVIGHSFPLYYTFKGGKGFLVTMSLVWFVDWKIGLIGLAVFLVLLFALNYMSLASVVSMLLCPIILLICECVEASGSGAWRGIEIAIVCLYAAAVLLMAIRHGENIKRLLTGQEKKFYLFGKKGKKQEAPKEAVPAQDEEK